MSVRASPCLAQTTPSTLGVFGLSWVLLQTNAWGTRSSHRKSKGQAPQNPNCSPTLVKILIAWASFSGAVLHVSMWPSLVSCWSCPQLGTRSPGETPCHQRGAALAFVAAASETISNSSCSCFQCISPARKSNRYKPTCDTHDWAMTNVTANTTPERVFLATTEAAQDCPQVAEPQPHMCEKV